MNEVGEELGGWRERIGAALSARPGMVSEPSTYPCRCSGGWILSVESEGLEALPCSSCRPVAFARWEEVAEPDAVLGLRNHLDHSRPASGCDVCQSIAATHRPGGAG